MPILIFISFIVGWIVGIKLVLWIQLGLILFLGALVTRRSCNFVEATINILIFIVFIIGLGCADLYYWLNFQPGQSISLEWFFRP